MTREIVIVGVGALGSHLALFLRNLDIQLKVIDFDRVEQKNTMSQFHTRMGVGRNKAQALAQSLQGLFNLRVAPIPHKLIDTNAETLLKGAALVCDCLDNGAGRRLVQDTAARLGIPCIHGALAADGQFGRVVWSQHFVVDDEDNAGQATCEDGEHLPFIASVAALMAHSVQGFLQHEQRRSLHVAPGRVITIDG